MNVLEKELRHQEILNFLPHRYPFIFVDRVLEVDTPVPQSRDFAEHIGVKVVAVKNVTFNEPYFQGHFPGFPIMPGVFVIEALAQASSFSLYPLVRQEGKKPEVFPELFLVSVNQCRFRKPVHPGDELRLQAILKKGKAGIWAFDCEASVDGKKVAETEIMAKLELKKVENKK